MLHTKHKQLIKTLRKLVQFLSHLIDVILFKLSVYITSTGLRLGTQYVAMWMLMDTSALATRNSAFLIKDNLRFGNLTFLRCSRKSSLPWSPSKWGSLHGRPESMAGVPSLSYLGGQSLPLRWGGGSPTAAAFPHWEVSSSGCALN